MFCDNVFSPQELRHELRPGGFDRKRDGGTKAIGRDEEWRVIPLHFIGLGSSNAGTQSREHVER